MPMGNFSLFMARLRRDGGRTCRSVRSMVEARCPFSYEVAASHSPHHNFGASRRLPSTEHLLLPAPSLVPVENDQMPGFRRAAVHVPGGLFEALPDCALQSLVEHLAFDDEPAVPIPLRPEDEQVGAVARSRSRVGVVAPSAINRAASHVSSRRGRFARTLPRPSRLRGAKEEFGADDRPPGGPSDRCRRRNAPSVTHRRPR